MVMSDAAKAIQEQWNREVAAERRGVIRDRRSSTYVYIVSETGTTRPCKIGIAQDVTARLCSLQTGNPRPLVVLSTLMTGTRARALYLEGEVLQRYSSALLQSEWLDVDSRDLMEMLSALAARKYDEPRAKNFELADTE